MWVQSLSQEDPLEEEMAPDSSILNLLNPKDRGARQATVHGLAEWDMIENLRNKKNILVVLRRTRDNLLFNLYIYPKLILFPFYK